MRSQTGGRGLPEDLSIEHLVWGTGQGAMQGPNHEKKKNKNKKKKKKKKKDKAAEDAAAEAFLWCVASHCAGEQCSFIEWCATHGHTQDAIGNDLFGAVTSVVAHAWKDSYRSLVDALTTTITPTTNTSPHPGHPSAPTQPAAAAFFIDVFVINQHCPPWREAPTPLRPEQMLAPPITACGTTTLVLASFSQPTASALGQSWCVWEAYLTKAPRSCTLHGSTPFGASMSMASMSDLLIHYPSTACSDRVSTLRCSHRRWGRDSTSLCHALRELG